MLDRAVALVHAGFFVFPLLPRSKNPRFKGSFHNATIDPAAITAHWTKYPTDNIGIRPGIGMGVVDVDPRAGGDLALAAMEAENGTLPSTWTAQTGSGGWHLWFLFGAVELRGKLCPGVDLKSGKTGYIVGPGSIHPNGNPYLWTITPDGFPATPPDWLQERVQRPQPAQRPNGVSTSSGVKGNGPYPVQCLTARIGKAPVGDRNRVLYGAARDAHRQGDLDAYEADLVAAATLAGLPGREIDATIRSARNGAA
jgi:hypothetical protein